MTTKSKKIVATYGDYAIEREEYWGFRCQTTSVSWNIYKAQVFIQSCARLRDAKNAVAQSVAKDSEVDAIDQYLRTVTVEA